MTDIELIQYLIIAFLSMGYICIVALTINTRTNTYNSFGWGGNRPTTTTDAWCGIFWPVLLVLYFLKGFGLIFHDLIKTALLLVGIRIK